MLALMAVSIFAIVIPFAIYPLMLWAQARFAAASVQSGADTPAVDLVICAFNEAQSIEAKLHNAISLDYPAERLTIWVASDGSTDETVEKARAIGDARIHILDLPRSGKAAALNAAVSVGSAAVIAFSDANSVWASDALRALVAPLNDPAIGGVAGDQRYHAASGNSHPEDSSGERGYWNFDRRLKMWQAQSGNAISATGAIYCIRRALFQPAPADATDDFMISTAVIAAGYRLVFAPAAIAFEPPARSVTLEYRRKVRVITRGLRGVYYRRALLDPRRTGSYALNLLIHKVWRRLVWIPVLILLIASPFAFAHGGLPALLGGACLVFLILAAAGICFTRLRGHWIFSVPAYIAVVNAACATATWNLLRGERISQWHLPRDTAHEPVRRAQRQA